MVGRRFSGGGAHVKDSLERFLSASVQHAMPPPTDVKDRPIDHDQPVRDQLAIDRTILSNERTMLAYLRTALTMLIVSFALIRFVDGPVFITLGVLLIPVSLAIGWIGRSRYRRRKAMIRRLYGQTPLSVPERDRSDAAPPDSR